MKQTHQFRIQGMSCASCASKIQSALAALKHVTSANVNFALEKGSVETDSESFSPKLISEILDSLGYKAVFSRSHSNDEASEEAQLKREKIELGIALLLSIPLALPMFFPLFSLHWMLPGWAQITLAIPVQFYFGRSFLIQALKNLRISSSSMDTLVVIGTNAAFFMSLWILINDPSTHPHLYFESSAWIICFVLLGKHLEKRARLQAKKTIRALYSLAPTYATVAMPEGKEVRVPILELALDQIIVMKPGERIPADGLVTQGQSSIDESMITGESRSVEKNPGDSVLRGTINELGNFRFKVTATGENTALEKIITLVEKAQMQRAPTQKLVDKLLTYFVPMVLLSSAITLFACLWIAALPLNESVLRSIAVLLIACPCALGLATPISLLMGTSMGAKNGILIKDIFSLEVAHKINLIVFDKTGTLTEGKPQLENIFSLGKEDVLNISRALQKGSEHPLAKALLQTQTSSKDALLHAEDVKSLPGVGIEGKINGTIYRIVAPSFFASTNVFSLGLSEWMKKNDTQGNTTSFLLKESEIMGALAFSDTIRTEALTGIRLLQKRGISVLILSGDHLGAVKKVADYLGISDFVAQCKPKDKWERISTAQKTHKKIVAIVGDGINDSPALSAADLSIALSSGTDIAMESSGIVLMRRDLTLINAAIELSWLTHRKIQQNLFWALIYNVIGMPVAAMGYLSPLLASTAMALSSVCVVLNALLLGRWRPQSNIGKSSSP